MHKAEISLVVPVYNSAQSLDELARRIDAALPAESYVKELLLVNDDSRDGSWQKIEELGKRYPWVRGIGLMRNYGQHNALLVGISHAQYGVLVTLDDDLQHPPEEIPALVAQLQDNVDVVYGIPQVTQHNLIKRCGTKLVRSLVSRMLSNNIAKHVSAFRAFRTDLRPAFEHCRGDYVNIDSMLYWATTRFATVRISHQPRKYGATNYTFWKNMAHALNLITGYSVLPLQVASILGFALVILGLAIFCFVVWGYFVNGGVVKGFAFTIATIVLFSGVQMFCLGIIGAYLARIHLRSSGKPVALIRKVT